MLRSGLCPSCCVLLKCSEILAVQATLKSEGKKHDDDDDDDKRSPSGPQFGVHYTGCP